MQHADTQAVLICFPSEEQGLELGGGGGVVGFCGGLARSTEGGRPGSRPAVTFNLDLVSIGVSGPTSIEE